jgi:hypothetical protein
MGLYFVSLDELKLCMGEITFFLKVAGFLDN